MSDTPDRTTGPGSAAKPRKPRRTREVTDPPADGPELPPLHSFFKKATPQRLDRAVVNPAPYNPRTIDAAAQVKLDNGLRRFGMVEPLVWNRRTGNLVGGHQRLRLMDQHAGKAFGYSVEAMVVDLDETDEKTLNVLLNNEGAQGWWNGQQLANLFASDRKLNPEDMGFDTSALRMFLERSGAELATLDLSHVFPAETDPSVKQDAETISGMKATKQEAKAAAGEASKDGFYTMVVFPTAEMREKFNIAGGANPLNKTILGVPFCDRLGIDVGQKAVATDPTLAGVTEPDEPLGEDVEPPDEARHGVDGPPPQE